MTEDDQEPEGELRDMLRELLSGGAGVDPAKLAASAGLPSDPASMARLFAQLQGALNSSDEGINWQLATDQAKSVASRTSFTPTDQQRRDLDQAMHLASLRLQGATEPRRPRRPGAGGGGRPRPPPRGSGGGYPGWSGSNRRCRSGASSPSRSPRASRM